MSTTSWISRLSGLGSVDGGNPLERSGTGQRRQDKVQNWAQMPGPASEQSICPLPGTSKYVNFQATHTSKQPEEIGTTLKTVGPRKMAAWLTTDPDAYWLDNSHSRMKGFGAHL